MVKLKEMAKKAKTSFLPRFKLPKRGPNSTFSLVVRSGLAELVAAAFYSYVGIGSMVAAYSTEVANVKLQSAIGHGLAAYVLSHATGHLSGGHFGNPVVSLGMMFSRRLSVPEFGVYFFSQLMGSLLGGAVVYGTRNQKAFDNDLFTASCNVKLKPAAADVTDVMYYPEGALFLSEMIACALLCFVVLACCDPATQLSPTSGPHAIGMTVAAVHLASDYNVAANFLRSFAAAVIANQQECWEGQWVFWIAGVAGALVAVLIYGTFGALGRSSSKKRVQPNLD